MMDKPIINLSSNRINTIDIEEMYYGVLYIDENDKGIYVKDIYSRIYRTGASYRNLEDFPDFLLEETSNSSFVRVLRDSQGKLRLGTSIPFISINDLSGVEISTFNDKYLGFNSEGTLVDLGKPLFKLEELADVENLSLTSNFNNFVLTYVYSSAPFKIKRSNSSLIDKDVLGKDLSGSWRLRPEASQIISFDDAGNNPQVENQIYRIPKASEGEPYLYENQTLDISFDTEPKLSNDLVCQGNSLIHQVYSTTRYDLTEKISTVTLNVISDNFLYLNTTIEVKLINIDINLSNIDNGKCYTLGIVLTDYSGSLSFNYPIIFENGVPPVLLGGDVLLGLNINTNTRTIMLNQKNLSII